MTTEQQEEVDILQSIYPDEIDVHSETRYSVHLRLETSPPRGLHIEVEYPEKYPEEEIPQFVISAEEIPAELLPVMDERDAPDYIYDFVSTDLATLHEQAEETAAENLGMPSVFTVISQIKESAEQLYAAGIAAKQAAHLKEIQIAEEQEQAKFRGTPVTKESYAAWFAKFLAEKKVSTKSEQAAEGAARALTGREIFERGIQGDSDDEE